MANQYTVRKVSPPKPKRGAKIRDYKPEQNAENSPQRTSEETTKSIIVELKQHTDPEKVEIVGALVNFLRSHLADEMAYKHKEASEAEVNASNFLDIIRQAEE
jgi:hypothetical protein